jgi:hypothetical protein
MGWPQFDPMARSIRELTRRAKRLAVTHGKTGSSEDGGCFCFAQEAGVSVYIASRQLVIRISEIDETKSWRPRAWQLVYSENGSGDETSRDRSGRIEEAVKRLRRLQVLDDLADA